jgi:hypothetical protein
MRATEMRERIISASSIEGREERWKRLLALKQEVRETGVRFSKEDIELLFQTAARLFTLPATGSVKPILQMILIGSEVEPKTKMELSGTLSEDSREIRVWDLLVDLMKREGFIPESENVLYCDQGQIFFGGRTSWRDETFILTDSRIIVVGFYALNLIGNESGYRLYYDDWESMPYLHGIDFIDYSKILSLKAVWKLTSKGIKMKCDTKYVKVRQQVIYGPYFFKFERGRKEEVLEGEIEITFKSYKKERHEKSFNRLKEFTGL